jgi:hypothetical protein
LDHVISLRMFLAKMPSKKRIATCTFEERLCLQVKTVTLIDD